MGRGVTGRIIEGIRRRREDSELQQYATEPPGAMGEQEGSTFHYEVEPKATVPFGGPGSKPEPWFHPMSGSVQAASIEDAVEEVSLKIPGHKMYPEHRVQKILGGGEKTGTGGFVYDGPEYKVTVTPSGAVGESCRPDHEDDDSLTVEEVERLCPECAESMRERGVTGVKLGPTLESGIFEIAGDDDPEGVLFEKKGKDGWPKKIKKGRFTTWCKREGFEGPSISCAEKAMDSDDESVRGMASFYMNTVQPGGKTATAVADETECVGKPDEKSDKERERGLEATVEWVDDGVSCSKVFEDSDGALSFARDLHDLGHEGVVVEVDGGTAQRFGRGVQRAARGVGRAAKRGAAAYARGYEKARRGLQKFVSPTEPPSRYSPGGVVLIVKDPSTGEVFREQVIDEETAQERAEMYRKRGMEVSVESGER